MVRAIAAGGAFLVALGLAGCGHQGGAGGSRDGATLAAYVMDAATPKPPSPGQPGQQPAQPGQQAAPACSNGQGAYKVLVFLVSSDTGMSVQQILGGLRAGHSLDDIAGARSGEVTTQAMGLVQAWLQFAEANGKLTAEQAEQYRAAASVVIDALMAANVAACVPAAA